MADDRPTRGTPRSILNAVTSSSASSVVVPVLPNDQLDAVAARVREVGGGSVQLLIPDGAAVFRSARAFRVLRVLVNDAGLQLQVISGDPQTLAAAREAGVETLGVDTAPPPKRAPQRPTGPAITRPIDDHDAAFLRDLDQVSSQDAYVEPDDREADLYASVDDLAGPYPAAPARPEPRAGSTDARRPSGPRRPPDEAMRRLSEGTAEVTRVRRTPRAEPDVRDSRQVRPRPAGAAAQSASGGAVAYDDAFPAARRPLLSANLIALLVVIALLVAGAAWALSNRVTVLVDPPSGEARQVPFEDEAIALTTSPPQDTAAAVTAAPVSSDAQYQLVGQVGAETISPVGRARGQVRIINTIEQSVPLPEGTELVGENAEGNQVRFLIDQATTVPPATTTTSDAGRSTTYGEVTIAITARSPGSASNLGANAIKQVVIPGQQPIISDQSNFLLRHEPISGGSEEPQRIVTEADVQAVLTDALTNLYNVGLQELEAQAAPQGLSLDVTTVTPSIAELASPASYEVVSVVPAVGAPLEAGTPGFTITVRTRFSALATPKDAPVQEQLKSAVTNHFSQPGSVRCKEGEVSAPQEVTYRWSGERLTVNGYVACTPLKTVPPETVAAIRAALVGQSREAAAASLAQYEGLGVIGGYELPDRDELPPLELLIEVQVR